MCFPFGEAFPSKNRGKPRLLRYPHPKPLPSGEGLAVRRRRTGLKTLSAFGLRNEFSPLPSTKTAFLVLGTRFFPFPSTEMAFLVLGPTFIPTLTVVMADLIGHLPPRPW